MEHRQETTAMPDRGGLEVFDSLLVRQPVRDPATVREAVATWADDRDADDADVRSLVPAEGVTLATLFLDTEGGSLGRDGPALVWYLEVVDDDAPAWRDAEETVRASPLFDALDGVESGTVHRDGDGHLLATHATNPERAARYDAACGRSLVAPVAGEDLSLPVAVVTLRLRPGVRSRVVWHAARAVDRLKSIDAVDRRVRGKTDVIEAEAVYTESLLLERRSASEGHLVTYYMETESMDRLYEAFEASDDWAARLSEWLFARVFVPADVERLFTPPLESDAEVLVHAVHPDRP